MLTSIFLNDNDNDDEMSASVVWKHFNDIMQMAIEKFVPIRPSDSKKKKPLWMTGSVLRTVKKKTQIVEKMARN